MTFAGRTFLISFMLASAPAFADGWIHCGSCNANNDAASIGSALALVGLVGYGLARRRK